MHAYACMYVCVCAYACMYVYVCVCVCARTTHLLHMLICIHGNDPLPEHCCRFARPRDDRGVEGRVVHKALNLQGRGLGQSGRASSFSSVRTSLQANWEADDYKLIQANRKAAQECRQP